MHATIYAASAGSGKTYTLAREWLSATLSAPESAYRSLLAITFTRKATGEIKDRLLRFLEALAYAPEREAQLCETLCQTLGSPDAPLSQADLRTRAQVLLAHMLENYGHISVFTIDSFFLRLVNAFYAELGLPSQRSLLLDMDRPVREITAHTLARMGIAGEEDLTRWVIHYAQEQLRNGNNWKPEKLIRTLVAESLSDKHSPYITRLGEQPPIDFAALKQTLCDSIRGFNQQLITLQAEFQDILSSSGLERAAFQRAVVDKRIADFDAEKASGITNALKQINGKALPKTIATAMLDSEKWLLKPKVKTMEAQTALASGLHEVLCAFYQLCYGSECAARRQYLTDWAIYDALTRLGLFSHLGDSLEAYKRENEVSLIGETGPLIQKLHAKAEVPFLYEKLGDTYQHIMIDEFQDTSSMQWQNLLPLLENTLVHEQGTGKVMLVGDVKQSIYRFRGGNSELLRTQAGQDLAHSIPGLRPRQKYLLSNYRSLPQVVRFNNTLCLYIANQLGSQLPDYLGTAKPSQVTRLQNVYAHATQVPRKAANPADAQGYVSVRLLSSKEFGKRVCDLLPYQVQALQARGFALNDITILVRTNTQAANVVEALSPYVQVYASEALQVKSGAGVRMLVGLLRWLANDRDRIGLYVALAARLSPAAGERESFSLPHYQQQSLAELLALLSTELDTARVQLLRQLPLFEMCCELMRMLGLRTPNTPLDSYLTAFLTLVQQRTMEGDSLPQFLEYFAEEGSKKQVTVSRGNAVQVLTVHKSKGLEFPVVIMPFVSEHFKPDAKRTHIMWAEDVATYPHSKLYPVDAQEVLSESTLDEDLFREFGSEALDVLNNLYVGVTRAAQELHIFAAVTEKEGSPGIHQLLRAALGTAPVPEGIARELNEEMRHEVQQVRPGISEEEMRDFLFTNYATEKGTPTEFSQQAGYPDISEVEEVEAYAFGTPVQRQPVGTVRAAAQPTPLPEPKAETTTPLAALAYVPWTQVLSLRNRSPQVANQPAQEQAISHGELVHDLLAQLRSPQDLDRVLDQALADGRIHKAQRPALQQELAGVLHLPEMVPFLADEWRWLPEYSLLTAAGKLLRPDLVCVRDRQAVVIDYKTGQPHAEHPKQIHTYAAVLRQLGYAVNQGLLVYTATPHAQQVEMGD